jgi:hypothetical protein
MVILKVADQDVTKVFRAAWPRLLAKIVSDPETHYACKSCYQKLETTGRRFNVLQQSLRDLQSSLGAAGLYSIEEVNIEGILIGQEDNSSATRKRTSEVESRVDSTPKRSCLQRDTTDDSATTPQQPPPSLATPSSEAVVSCYI